MPDAIVTDRRAAYREVDDFTTGQTADGFDIQFGHMAYGYRADAAITKGQPINFVVPTTTVPVSVTPATTAAVGLFAGVALADAAEGDDDCLVACYGFVVADAGAGIVAGDPLEVVGGVFDTDATPAADTTVAEAMGPTFTDAGGNSKVFIRLTGNVPVA